MKLESWRKEKKESAVTKRKENLTELKGGVA